MQLINNAPPSNHSDEIGKLLSNCSAVDLAVAYITTEGAQKLLSKHLLHPSSPNIRIITTRDYGVTKYKAIKYLYSAGIQIKIKPAKQGKQHKQGTYHPKLWLFYDQTQACTCLVGSANLTSSALTNNVECGVLFKGPDTMQFEEYFEDLWHRSRYVEVDTYYLQNWQQESKFSSRMRKKIRSKPGLAIILILVFLWFIVYMKLAAWLT